MPPFSPLCRRRHGHPVLVAALSLVLIVAASCAGATESGGVERTADSATPDQAQQVRLEDLEHVLEAEDGIVLSVDQAAGPKQIGCYAEYLLDAVPHADLLRYGLPTDLDGFPREARSHDDVVLLLRGLFGCVDMTTAVTPDDPSLTDSQRRCIAEEVASDPEVGTLFLVGTSGGTGSGISAQFRDEIARLDTYWQMCVMDEETE